MTLQPASIIFPDAELWATGAFRGVLAARTEPYAQDVHVGNRGPSTRKPRMVIIRRDGGPSRGLLDFPRLGVNVWGATDKEAADLARLSAALLLSLPGDGTCVRLQQVSGSSWIEDAQPRRFMTFEAALRGELEA